MAPTSYNRRRSHLRPSWAMALWSAVVAATGLTSAALGQPRIVQVGCDTLSLAPPLVRVQFRVENLGEYAIRDGIYMVPLQPGPTPPDTCSPPILQCGAPPGWGCGAQHGSALWWPLDWDRGIPPGAALDSFAVVTDVFTDPSSCCYRALFLLPIPEAFLFVETFCFACDNPVPVRPTTWGKVKLLYR